MSPTVIHELAAGARDAIRLSVALLTAPYYISKAFVTRPLDEPFHWTWDNKLPPPTNDNSVGN